MSLSNIRSKNRIATTLAGSKINQILSSDDSQQMKQFFKQIVEPINQRTFENYTQNAGD